MTGRKLKIRIAQMIAAVVPIAACGSTPTQNENCYGVERAWSLDFPVTPDAGVMIVDPATCSDFCARQANGSSSEMADVTVTKCSATPDAGSGGAVHCEYQEHRRCFPPGVVEGRRPAGLLAAAEPEAATELGSLFARMAHVEGASVLAFESLRDELRAHRAPRHLVRDAELAASDEVRHQRMMTRLARRHGATPRAPRVAPQPIRGLEQMAMENAVEGCVRETFGAIVAAWQADHALDGAVRATMQVIAEDETRHAALAWRVAMWVEPRLLEAARRRILRTRRAALEALLIEVSIRMPCTFVTDAGLPPQAEARALVEQLIAFVENSSDR